MEEKRPKVKILVGYHKPATLLKDDVFAPIHLGRALATEASKDGKMSQEDYQWMLDNMIGDDTGDNISNQNRVLNEMTGIYWAWKNYDQLGNPDFIGFWHYRRILDFNNFSENLQIEPSLGIPFVDYLNKTRNYFNIEKILSDVSRYKYITSKHHKINPYHHYESAYQLNVKDYDLLLSIIDELCPKYSPYAKIYNRENKAYFCNTFVMPKEQFFEYAEFMFAILFEFAKRIDMTGYSMTQKRAVAYSSEWLTAIYFTYLDNTQRKIKELPMIYVKNTDIAEILKPSKGDELSICFSCDDNYLPYLATCIKSLVEHANDNKFYQIYILNEKLLELSKSKLLELETENVKIKFVNILPYLEEVDSNLFFEFRHFTKAVYYRFFIPQIFKKYKKIIYCDCDAIFLSDPAELYQINLEDKILGAVIDIEIRKQLFIQDNSEYYFLTLNLKNPRNYFNSGFLIFNLPICIQNNLTSNCLMTLKKIKTPYTVDQDILNIVCEEKVKFLEQKWNVENHLVIENNNLVDLLSEEDYKSYIKSLDKPKFLHFTSSLKPWEKPASYNASLFWKYAKMTPFYEEIIYNLSTKQYSNMTTKFTLYNNFMQRIFSVKNLNTDGKIFKVITILGIKIKFRRSKNK